MTRATHAGFSVMAEGVTVAVADERGGREPKNLLADVSFRIEPGEFVCVLGPSGAGKSTLVRAILGEREIAAGRLEVGGHGEVVWFGSRVEALGHFGVYRLADVYLAIEDKPPGYWSARWRERQAEDRLLAAAEESSTATVNAVAVTDRERVVALDAVSIPGFGRQFPAFACREIETVIRDRRGLAMSLLLPIALGLAVLVGFSTVRFRNQIMHTRLLDPGEKDVLADVWGEVREAIATESVAEVDASIPGQIRVFLDSQPKMLAHLREPSTERLVRAALTDALPLAPHREIVDPSGTFKWLSLMSICMVILGFVSGFREIVKERPMLGLERRHGL